MKFSKAAPTSAPQTPPPLPATLAACEAEFARLAAEKAALADRIGGFSALEAALLEQGADDAAHDDLAADRRRCDRALLRLELRENALLHHARDLQSAADDAAWAAVQQRHREAMAIYLRLARAALEAADAVRAVAHSADARRLGGGLTLPLPPPLGCAEIEATERALHVERARFPTPPVAAELVPLRFVCGWRVYQAGDVASFPRRDAEKLAAAGVATVVTNPPRSVQLGATA